MEKIKDFLRDAAIPIAGGIIGAFIGMGIVCQQAEFETENADMIASVLSSYSINGVSMQFGSAWNVFTDKGVAMRRDTYALLCQTGLCCRLAR